MKFHRQILTIILSTIMVLSLTATAVFAHTAWNSNRGTWITLTKVVTVVKSRHNRHGYVSAYLVPKGYHYKLQREGRGHTWKVMSGHFKSNSRYTYWIDKKPNSSNWFKLGIHHMK